MPGEREWFDSLRSLTTSRAILSGLKRVEGSLFKNAGFSLVFLKNNAEGGSRTHMRFPPLDFESSASTSFTTSAL